MVAHSGDFYDGENEGEDRKNRQEYKRRTEENTSTGIVQNVPDASKKMRFEDQMGDETGVKPSNT